MYLILNVGSTGTGKSTMIFETMKTANRVLVYDYQKEYTDLPVYKDQILPQMRFTGSMPDFLELVKKVRGKGFVVVIEEATGVFESRINIDSTRLLLSKRHDKTSYILNFHSMQDVPPKIWRYTDLLYLRKTNDMSKDIRKKYPTLFNSWVAVSNDSNRYACKVLKISNLTRDKNI